MRDLTVADDADIDRIAAAVSTFFGRKAFKEHVRVLAARVERGEGPYDRPTSKPAAKKKPAPKRAPPKRKAPPPEESSSSESEDERAAAARSIEEEGARERTAAARGVEEKEGTSARQEKEEPRCAEEEPPGLRRRRPPAAADVRRQGRGGNAGKAQEDVGTVRPLRRPAPDRRTARTSRSRARRSWWWRPLPRSVAAIRTGMTGALEQVVMDDAPGRPPTLLGSTKRAEAEVRIAPKSYPFADRDTALRVAAKNPKKRGSASWDRYERYKQRGRLGNFGRGRHVGRPAPRLGARLRHASVRGAWRRHGR